MILKKPIVLVSIPKSGTNVLLKFFSQYPNYESVSPKFGYTSSDVDDIRLGEFISKLQPGQVYWSHLTYSKHRLEIMKKYNIALVFLYRDPRDILCSMAHYYGTNSKSGNPYTVFLKEETSIQDKIRKLLIGNSDKLTIGNDSIPAFSRYIKNYVGWLYEDEYVFNVSYEDIIHSKKRLKILIRLQAYIKGISWRILINNYFFGIPKTTRTFRKGESGGYLKEFNEDLYNLYEVDRDIYKEFEFKS